MRDKDFYMLGVRDGYAQAINFMKQLAEEAKPPYVYLQTAKALEIARSEAMGICERHFEECLAKYKTGESW